MLEQGLVDSARVLSSQRAGPKSPAKFMLPGFVNGKPMERDGVSGSYGDRSRSPYKGSRGGSASGAGGDSKHYKGKKDGASGGDTKEKYKSDNKEKYRQSKEGGKAKGKSGTTGIRINVKVRDSDAEVSLPLAVSKMVE
jgi:hypothetical protein